MNTSSKSDFDIKIIRTNRRKTASIRIDAGVVQITVPNVLSDKSIQDIIDSKSTWIDEKLQLQSSIAPARPKQYVSGETFLYLGKKYRLKLTNNSAQTAKLKRGELLISTKHDSSEEHIKHQISQWYWLHAEHHLKDKTSRYAEILKVIPKSVSLKNYKARWGSCTITNDIIYNWKIIIAPSRIVDYVVVHELSHIHEHNHSPSFWKLVSKVIPDYKDCRKWLKINGPTLNI